MPVTLDRVLGFCKEYKKDVGGILLTVLSCMVLVQEEIILNFRILT